MCRFLMLKSRGPIDACKILERFAEMAEKSKAPDGDWQGDGWGVSWLDQDENWRVKKSILPIWREKRVLSQIPESHLFLAHARSASFPQHKEVLAYNQPFVEEPYAFVFNGLLKGVSFASPVPGKIGSQKIWAILSELLKRHKPQDCLLHLRELLKRNSRMIHALNIGLGDNKNLYACCQYEENSDYYQLHFFHSPVLKIICSEPLPGYDFQPVRTNDVFVF